MQRPCASELRQFGTDIACKGDVISLCVKHESTLPELVRWLGANGIGLYSLQSRRQSLESLFVQAMGGQDEPG